MIKLFIYLFLITSISLSQSKFGTETTLDIVTWNIQNFPKNDRTIEEVKNIIEKIDADIIAFQEISDSIAFYELASYFDEYSAFVKINYQIGLAYLYKNKTLELDTIYEMYTDYEYWNNFPRAPLFLEFSYKDQKFIIINNHLKCCGDGKLENSKYDEENRRLQAMGQILSYTNANFQDINHIILGDLNDEIQDPIEDNVFTGVINNPDKYIFADKEIAFGDSENWSYPSYPSHLDHIIINKTLFDDFYNLNSEIKTLNFDAYYENGFSDYRELVSDHRPVALKLELTKTNTHIYNNKTTYFHNNILYFEETISTISIYNTLGQNMYHNTNLNYIDLNFLPEGIYLIITNHNQTYKIIKN